MDPVLTVEAFHGDGGVVLLVRGEIDASTAPILRDAIEQHSGLNALVVDLADVTFMDSSGLVVFVAAQRKQHDEGGLFWVRNPATVVRRVFAVTDLEALIEPT